MSLRESTCASKRPIKIEGKWKKIKTIEKINK